MYEAERFPGSVPLLATAFQEQAQTVRKVWDTARDILGEGLGADPRYRVTLAALPGNNLEFERNIFSSFFIAALCLLPKVTARRRFLYSCFNQLFRVWVTSADNLLDNEDKETFRPLMPGQSHTMRQVVNLMLADRVMHKLLGDAVIEGTLSAEESDMLSDRTLRVLLPSAAEEGMEEGGMEAWPHPDTVLDELHPLKTGILFQLSFMGPEALEYGDDPTPLLPIKHALMDFGIGCQILDDIRDMTRDFRQRKANYVLAMLLNGPDADAQGVRLLELTEGVDLETKIYTAFPQASGHAFELASARLARGFKELDRAGLSGLGDAERALTRLLHSKLDLGENQV